MEYAPSSYDSGVCLLFGPGNAYVPILPLLPPNRKQIVAYRISSLSYAMYCSGIH